MSQARTRTKTLAIQGSLLIFVALIHLIMTPEIRYIVARNTTPLAFALLWPPYALDHVAVGILLVPIGLVTILCSQGVAMGDLLARRIATINALTVVSLPTAVFIAVPPSTLIAAPPFLAATIMLVATGLWMLWPLFRSRASA